MNNGHTAVNEFLSDKERFADFFNGNFFQRQQIVKPEELEVMKGESDILLEDKKQKEKPVHRYRDIVMRWNGDMYLAILACEVQSLVQHGDYFRRVNAGTNRAIAALLQSSKLMKLAVSKKEEEHERDMCKALDDLYEEGIEQGIEQGIALSLSTLVQKKLAKGQTVENIAEALEESVETIREIMQNLNSESF